MNVRHVDAHDLDVVAHAHERIGPQVAFTFVTDLQGAYGAAAQLLNCCVDIVGPGRFHFRASADLVDCRAECEIAYKRIQRFVIEDRLVKVGQMRVVGWCVRAVIHRGRRIDSVGQVAETSA